MLMLAVLVCALGAQPEAPKATPPAAPAVPTKGIKPAYERLDMPERALCDKIAKTCIKGPDGSVWNKAAFDVREKGCVGMTPEAAKLYEAKDAPLFYNLATGVRAKSTSEVAGLVAGSSSTVQLPPEARLMGCRFVHKIKIHEVRNHQLRVQRIITPGIDECHTPQAFMLRGLPSKYKAIEGATIVVNMEMRIDADPIGRGDLGDWSYVKEFTIDTVKVSPAELVSATGADVAEAIELADKREIVEWYVGETKPAPPKNPPPRDKKGKPQDANTAKLVPVWMKKVTKLTFAPN